MKRSIDRRNIISISLQIALFVIIGVAVVIIVLRTIAPDETASPSPGSSASASGKASQTSPGSSASASGNASQTSPGSSAPASGSASQTSTETSATSSDDKPLPTLHVADNAPESGLGQWMFGNYMYTGYWENHMPNGEGWLTCSMQYGFVRITGNWVDGLADGDIEVQIENYGYDSDQWTYSYQLTYDISVAEGRVSEVIYLTSHDEDGVEWEITPDYLFGAPPWADFWVDPESIPTWSDYLEVYPDSLPPEVNIS